MIDYNKYNSKKVGILGLGITGQSIFNSLNQSDAEIFLWDDNLAIRKENICYQGNLKNTNDWPWEELDYFFPSPGINLKQEFFVKNLKKYKTKLMSDISLFEDARGSIFPSGTLVAITGTNGKSSTATMLYEILKNEGRDVRLAGNIGIPILSLKPGTSETIYIIEMSSFQIELTENIKPEIAVLLNISQDHLDRHSSIEEYRDIKSRIFTNQNSNHFSLICDEDEQTNFVSKMEFKSKKIIIEKSNNRDEKEYYYKNLNILKEVLKILGIPDFSVNRGIKNFRGLRHRMELVCQNDKIKFVNDSKATNTSATNLAFSLNKKIFWIGGGDSKGSDLSKINLLSENLERVFLIGSSAQKIFNLTPKSKKPIVFENLISAIKAAYKEASKSGGGCILLSPGCSSHDQFLSYEERGEIFSKTALSLITLEK
ncbi:MAG: UDP-N-acetylmuramoyl-L-alanine--D-glutamate ligase [Hyphomicrobiales bacterium]|jgi:UDP-N-acetylmuramoylalanine--D-glutamate ligase|nr:UDP-N-acetylmuramoyl-L-alanine--D-glutamate ligase [Hyphomicrobiales bacterium]MDG1523510.1 UDP-N-acetylmuramoyl-L-alanine--D-glutamate ligase [Hyphomicrobiales bacterium]MDG1665024.1 UDP-N-acetylmuramoyl-L-alanine--D-glutamate ligase [Hyphomicrobiales bacterium]MDG2413341.1 UDP-N-acetylmuramoyl-L-alanine--D-glutamate ligase [Hyphomicrobiales bacterium]|tara:strand:+ start:5842 stop:7125 length:1284 start_codon:yes stop_codon:yes gene_type:complete